MLGESIWSKTTCRSSTSNTTTTTVTSYLNFHIYSSVKLFFYFCICCFFSMQCVWVFFFRLCSKRFCFVFICLKLIVKIRHCAFLICVYMKNCSLIDRTYCDDQGCLLILIEQIIIKFFILIVYYILK